MVRLGLGRFGVVGFWVGLRAWGFPTEKVLSRNPLIIRTVDQKSSPLLSFLKSKAVHCWAAAAGIGDPRVSRDLEEEGHGRDHSRVVSL